MPREATAKERRALTLRVATVERRSQHEPPFEWLELHLIPPATYGWQEAVADLAAAGERVRDILPAAVYDLDGLPPAGAGLCAVRVDNLTVDEVVTLQDRRWRLVEVRRIATVDGDLGAEDTHERRMAVAAARAGPRAWNYYRSSRWAFIYPMRPPRRT